MNGKKINRVKELFLISEGFGLHEGVNGFLKWIREIDNMGKAIHLLPALF